MAMFWYKYIWGRYEVNEEESMILAVKKKRNKQMTIREASDTDNLPKNIFLNKYIFVWTPIYKNKKI